MAQDRHIQQTGGNEKRMNFSSGSPGKKYALAVLSVYGKIMLLLVKRCMKMYSGFSCFVIESIRCGLSLMMNVEVA